ncbi:hypothetical protein NE237_033138 [Protea cynaroides]|uniref:Uncharacterized protein n=1 Tax=Protea cynaroides TaxID=273540 RepID=A0A9Q0L4W3_9MAGN|nr:hypothetical protein NE237_033138 [Protea cynaroides]
MAVAMPQNQKSYWTSISTNIEDHLKTVVQVQSPLSVYEPMYYLVFSSPRTMAPALSIAACELVGGQPEKAMTAASVLHLMYAASTARHRFLDRSMGINHHHQAFPANIELLTVDNILSSVYELLARPSINHHPDDKPEQILKVIIEISRAMGAEGIVKGLYLQKQRTGSVSDGKVESGVYSCGAVCGAILGGATREEIERLRSFGRYAGMIHGLMSSMATDEEKGLNEMVDRLRSLALKELEYFDHHPMVETISSILHLDSLLQFTSKQTQSLS